MNKKKDKQKQQVEKNFEAFQKELPKLLKKHRDAFALMRDGKVVEIFDDLGKAHRKGFELYEDEVFSIQEITDRSINLGFFSHALHTG